MSKTKDVSETKISKREYEHSICTIAWEFTPANGQSVQWMTLDGIMCYNDNAVEVKVSLRLKYKVFQTDCK